MPTLDNITTGDGYTSTNVLTLPLPVKFMTIIVSNNPVFAQFALQTPNDPVGRYTRDSLNVFDPTERRMLLASWTWTDEDFPDPATGALRGIVAVRLRSAVPGSPAQVTVHA